MKCGGVLLDVPKDQVRERVPARSFTWRDRFHECQRCGQVFWEGTHCNGSSNNAKRCQM